MKTKMTKMVMMKIMKTRVMMMNLSSCSGLMQTRGETEKKPDLIKLAAADYLSLEKSSSSCEVDRIETQLRAS